MKHYKTIICVVAAVCLLGTAAFCGFRIYYHYAQVNEQTEWTERKSTTRWVEWWICTIRILSERQSALDRRNGS